VAVASPTDNRRMHEPRDADDKRMELHEHLAELRSRIMRMILYAAMGGIFCYFFFKPIYSFLNHPMDAATKRLNIKVDYVFYNFTDPFFVVLQICLIAGLIVMAPLIILEVYGFVAPALTRQEKRPLLYVVPTSVALFAMGATLAYWVAPLAINFFVSYVSWFPQGKLMQDPQKYVLFMLKMMGIFGAVFQLPIMLGFLAWIGLLRSAGMKRTWRHAVVIISILGLVVVPTPDWFTMLAMIGPVTGLYLLSIFLVQHIEKKRDRMMRERYGS
jgi:sec-independent protein translocase protein TatC